MKPRIFIGSSKEALDIAYAIQDNLEHDANPTVWTQGIFQFSSNALDDLLKALQNFDFGIFVFKPDDVTILRTDKLNTIRDNVIFELGLFIGKLGKDKVFFVLPSDVKDFHLPTDLLGVNPGKYNNHREDGNLKAALGPFCNQVREKIKNFVWESLVDLANESDEAKRIALEKPRYWQLLLSAELLKKRLVEINRGYYELENNLIYQKSKKYDYKEYNKYLETCMHDISRLANVFKLTFETELLKSLNDPGNVYEIKFVIDKMTSLCKEFLAWEFELQSLLPPKEAENLKESMKGWTKVCIDEINKYPDLIKSLLEPQNIDKGIDIRLEFGNNPNIEKILSLLDEYLNFCLANDK